MRVQCAIFFFSWKYYTDLQLSLFYLKVVALRRLVVDCHSYRPVSERQCTNPHSLLSCEFLSCHRGAFEVSLQNWGMASRHCLIFIHLHTFRPLKMRPPRCSETSGTRHPVTQRHIPGERHSAVLTTHKQKSFRATVLWDLICHPEAFVWKFGRFPTSLCFGPPFEMNSIWCRDSWFVGLLYRHIACTSAGQLDVPLFRGVLGQEPRIQKAFHWWILISVHRTTTGCFHLVTSLLSLESLLNLPAQSASCASQQPEYVVSRQITRAALWPSLVSTLLCCAGVWGCIYFYLKNLLISNFDPNCLGGIFLGAGV
jgi:hypothetical protein